MQDSTTTLSLKLSGRYAVVIPVAMEPYFYILCTEYVQRNYVQAKAIDTIADFPCNSTKTLEPVEKGAKVSERKSIDVGDSPLDVWECFHGYEGRV